MSRSRATLLPALGSALFLAAFGCGDPAEVGDPQARATGTRGGSGGRGSIPGGDTGGSSVIAAGGSNDDQTTSGGSSAGGHLVLREASFSRAVSPEATTKWRLRESSWSSPERVCNAQFCLVGEIR